MNKALNSLLHCAASQGLVPPQALETLETQAADRHWSVVLLMAIGAWLASLPLLILLAFTMSAWIEQGAGCYVIGAVILVAALAVLRAKEIPVFLEQLALPALLVGTGLLGFGLERDLPAQAAGAIGLLIALACAAATERHWLRLLLGAACALLFGTMLWPGGSLHAMPTDLPIWVIAHAALLLWVLMLALQSLALGRSASQTRLAAALEPLASGWLLALLAGLTALSGKSFLADSVLGHGLAATPVSTLGQLGSAVMALMAAWLAQHRWPALRQARAAMAATVLAALCAFMPWLGACMVVLAVTATSHRWKLAATVALTATWIVGSFYYQLAWPLAIKALVLAGCGAMLGLLAWLGLHGKVAPPDSADAQDTAKAQNTALQRWAPWLIALTAACTLAMTNIGIVHKERTLAQGRRVFAELAPVDSRYLTQGNYMPLNFSLPFEGEGKWIADSPLIGRMHAIGRLDERGIVQWLRTGTPWEPLAPEEQRFELMPRTGQWTLVTDVWHFREGDGQRWEKARYGEFRVEPDGRTLLVGLTDAQLRPIQP